MELNFIINGKEIEPKQKRDFRGVLSVDDGGDAWIMASTPDCKECDIFQNGNLFADNGGSYTEDLNVGLYSCRFVPWSHQDYDGDWDGGVDAVDIVLIGAAPEEFLMKDSE